MFAPPTGAACASACPHFTLGPRAGPGGLEGGRCLRIYERQYFTCEMITGRITSLAMHARAALRDPAARWSLHRFVLAAQARAHVAPHAPSSPHPQDAWPSRPRASKPYASRNAFFVSRGSEPPVLGPQGGRARSFSGQGAALASPCCDQAVPVRVRFQLGWAIGLSYPFLSFSGRGFLLASPKRGRSSRCAYTTIMPSAAGPSLAPPSCEVLKYLVSCEDEPDCFDCALFVLP
jgi:hypothetical protein